jgi:catalase
MAKQSGYETDRGTGSETHQHVPHGGAHGDAATHLTTNQE